jgi:hypothetical protein
VTPMTRLMLTHALSRCSFGSDGWGDAPVSPLPHEGEGVIKRFTAPPGARATRQACEMRQPARAHSEFRT